jgi:hypothetical protein
VFPQDSVEVVRNLFPFVSKENINILVEPSSDEVLDFLKSIRTKIQGRVVLHYFGFGALPPTDNDQLYFFTNGIHQPESVRLSYILELFPQPLCFIFDCSFASSFFETLLINDKRVFAFFGTSIDESIPLSLDIPLDLFSMCLLNSFSTSIWFHQRRYSTFFVGKQNLSPESEQFLQLLFDSILEAIFFDTQKELQKILDKMIHLFPLF